MIMKTVLLSLIILLFTATGCAAFIRGPFSGKVIDAETKEPIEGAVVVVIWDKAIYGSPGGPSSYFQDAKETLTDKEGNFYIEKYYGFTINPLARIRNASLSLLIYKPGYIVFPSHMYFSKFPKSPFKVSSPTLAKLFTKGKKDIKMGEEVVVDKTALSELLTNEVTVVELPKVKTWLERINSHEAADVNSDIPNIKIPTLRSILKEDDNYLRPMYKYGREKLNIPVGEIPKW